MRTASATKPAVQKRSRASALAEEIRDPKEFLNRTFGLWSGRPLDPIAYQRKMRSSYAVRYKKSGR